MPLDWLGQRQRQQEQEENVLGGGGGTGGRKVGAVFLGPGVAEVWEQVKKRSCGVMPNIPSVPWGPAVRNKEEALKHFWISVCFCGCQKLFLSLSSYQNLLVFCLWCGKPKAVIWAMLLTGVHKCTQEHLHYTCPKRKHLIYPLICFKLSYLMLSVLEIWWERDISSLWWISVLFPRKVAAGNAS